MSEKNHVQTSQYGLRQRLSVKSAPQVNSTPQLENTLINQALTDTPSASPDAILRLQRSAGNRAVQRLLNGGQIQAKLTVGPARDHYEEEADRVASTVMRMPDSQPPTTQHHVDEETEEGLQAKPLADSIQTSRPEAGKGFEAGNEVESSLKAAKGGGTPLPGETRSFMENRFGADFGGVRVHTDPGAVQLNRDLQAQAFTHGSDIYFGEGRYEPNTSGGKHLLAHELTHVVQQGGAGTQSVQRSMAGAHRELIKQGGKLSAKGLLNNSSYSQILTQILDYRKEEKKKRGRKPASWFKQALTELETAVSEWIANPEHLNKEKRTTALMRLLVRIINEKKTLSKIPDDSTERFDEGSDDTSSEEQNTNEQTNNQPLEGGESFSSLITFMHTLLANRQSILNRANALREPDTEIYAILTGMKKPTGEPTEDTGVNGNDFYQGLATIEATHSTDGIDSSSQLKEKYSISSERFRGKDNFETPIVKSKTVFKNGRPTFPEFIDGSIKIPVETLHQRQQDVLNRIVRGDYNVSDPEIDVIPMTRDLDEVEALSQTDEQKTVFSDARKFAKDIFSLQGGFSHFRSQSFSDQGTDKMFRIYINVQPQHAIDLMGMLVREIVVPYNEFPGVRDVKMGGPRVVGKRHDSIVIYVQDYREKAKRGQDKGNLLSSAEENVRKVMVKLKAINEQMPYYFKEDVGPMQSQFGKGMGVGMEVNKSLTGENESFNTARAKALYTALNTSNTLEQFKALTRLHFAKYGFNFYNPHENL